MSEASQVVYIGGERVETTGVTSRSENECEEKSEVSIPSQAVYIGGKKSRPDQDSTNGYGQPEMLEKTQSPPTPSENIVANLNNVNHDASEPSQAIYIAGKMTEKIENLKDEVIEPAISIRVDDADQVSDAGYEQQKMPQKEEETDPIEIKSKEQDSVEDIISLNNFQVIDVSGDTSEQMLEQNIGNPIIPDTSKIISEREENTVEGPIFKTEIQIMPEEQFVAESNPENISQPQNRIPETSKSIYIKPEEHNPTPEPKNEILEILSPPTATNVPQERSTPTMDIKNGGKDTSEKMQPVSIAVENSESDTLSDKSDSTASINSSFEDVQNGTKTGLANPAFVNVDVDVLKEIEKKNKRTPHSLENNEKSLSADEGNGLSHELDNTSPPIMAEGTKNAKTEKEYSEYFIPENEKTKSFRGETEPLYETKSKDQGNTNWGKFCCWIFILALLAGAITVGVLIGIGVINLEPLRQIKESRNLDKEQASTDTAKLFEVTDADAPNVLTNDPDFFASKKNSSQGEESEPGNIPETDNNNGTTTNSKAEHSKDTSAPPMVKSDDMLLSKKLTSTPTETETSTELKNVLELTTDVPVETSAKANTEKVSTESKNILKQEAVPSIVDNTEQEITSESQQVISEEPIPKSIPKSNKPNKLPSEEAFELLKAEEVLQATIDKVIPEIGNDTKSVNNQPNEEEKTIFPETDPSNPSLSDIVTGQFLASSIPVEGDENVKDEDNVTDVIDKPVDIRVSEPRELVLPEA
eukprot:TRINITY_DN12988_c0_g1_i6.p1 TRINITY_DN12988_c0_g1~~TRINITY_DN12988_c0_g1_i6.p1  ORF type:complete len:756 (+),score=233.77 TRINITY_DN12988_c0_g1_i6:48-2315(+)